MELLRITILRNGTPIYTLDEDSLKSHIYSEGTVVYMWKDHNHPINQGLSDKGLILCELCPIKTDIDNRIRSIL